jgi:uncharacterized protein YutE (UPF0331/DUF86 family)
MIDPVLVNRKINLIGGDFADLSAYGRMPLEEYLGDRINEIVVERLLERIIGRMIDVNYHIVTELGRPAPKDYFESFSELGRIGVLPDEFARSIARAAGLRNRIVHEYDEVDERKVYEALGEVLRDIPRYVDYVNRYVESLQSKAEEGHE